MKIKFTKWAKILVVGTGFLLSNIMNAQVAAGSYIMTSSHSNKVLDIPNAAANDNVQLQQWDYNGSTAQQWAFESLGNNQYAIKTAINGKALTVQNASTSDGAAIVLLGYSGTNNQKWTPSLVSGNTYKIVNVQSGKNLDVFQGSLNSGGLIHQWANAAVASQNWKLDRLGANGTGLRADYWNNTNFTGNPVVDRVETSIDYNFGNGSPAAGVNSDNFCARWAGQVEAPVSGSYTFTVTADDGQRLWVNGVQLVNNWINQGPTVKTGTISLTAGQKYDIKYEYYEATGGAEARLNWEYAGQVRQVIPSTRLYPAAAMTTGGGGGSTTISITPATKYQTIEGFGFFGGSGSWWDSADPNYFADPVFIDKIVNDLGITMWRNEYYPAPTPTNPQDTRWDIQKKFVQDLNTKANQSGVNMKYLITVWSPPADLKCNYDNNLQPMNNVPSTYGTRGGGTLRTDRYNEYANWINAGIQLYKSIGITPYAFSPQNEPYFNQPFNSCFYSQSLYTSMIKGCMPAVRAANPGMKIFGAEHMLESEGDATQWPYFYHNAFLTDNTAKNLIDVLAVHGYSDGLNATASSKVDGLWNTIRTKHSEPNNKPLWMTETSGYIDNWESGNNPQGNFKPGALSLAGDIMSALVNGNLSAWVWWQGCENSGSTVTEYALMSKTTYGKKYHASKQFYRYLRPGARRLAATSSDGDIKIAAFEHTGKGSKTIILINNSFSAKTISLGGNGATTYTMFCTSATDNAANKGNVNASSVTLPARSVVTLVNGSTSLRVESDETPLNVDSFVKIFPNPATNRVSVVPAVAGEVSIMNMNGVELASKTSDGTAVEFDLSGYSSGIYLVKTGTKISKLVVE